MPLWPRLRWPEDLELGRVAGEPGRPPDHPRRRGAIALAGLLEDPSDLGHVDDGEVQRAGAGGVDRDRTEPRTSPSSR